MTHEIKLPSTDNSLGQVIDLAHELGGPIHVTQRGRRVVVVVPAQEFDEMLAAAEANTADEAGDDQH